jgi:acyl-CoA thioesterase YciA
MPHKVIKFDIKLKREGRCRKRILYHDETRSCEHAQCLLTPTRGDIFGGWLMSQMDMAGEITARLRARTRVVTVAVNAMTFNKPVHVGDVVSCYTRIERIGSTSITVKIEAEAMRQDSGKNVPVTEGVFVYVALGENGESTVVPQSS